MSITEDSAPTLWGQPRDRRRAACTRCGQPVVARMLCAYHYAKRRVLDHAEGTFQSTYTDAAAAAEHLGALRAIGLGLPRLSQLSGIPEMTLFRTGTRPRMSRANAAAILAIPFPGSPLDPMYADGSQVSGVGTTRRLRALCAIGWSRAYMTERLGAGDPKNLPLNRLYQGKQGVTAGRAREVAALYAELRDTPGPDDRSCKYAARLGWSPPSAWVDAEQLDDPEAGPTRVGPPVTTSRHVPDDFAEIVADHRELGRSDEEIARRLGLRLDTLLQRFRRLGIAFDADNQELAS